MSTKIHNGLILKGCTLEEALQRLKKIRPACVDRAKLATARQIAKKVVYRMDFSENWQALDRKDRKAVWQITEDFRKAQIAVTGEGIRSTTWDSSLDVCLIPSEGTCWRWSTWNKTMGTGISSKASDLPISTTRIRLTNPTPSRKKSGHRGARNGISRFLAGQSHAMSG